MERRVYQGAMAKQLYLNAMKLREYIDDNKVDVLLYGPVYQLVGGWWKCTDEELSPSDKGKNVWSAYDFTDGTEVFIEDFDSEEEAIKYANGILARTIDHIEM